MKAVLISVRPKWCKQEAQGKKTLELRKSKPKIDVPFKCYIYCTAITDHKKYTDELDIPLDTGRWCGNAHVIGEFVCDEIYEIDEPYLTWVEEGSCVDMNKIAKYKGDNEYIYAWHISDLIIYDEPKKLSEFSRICSGDCDFCKYKRLEPSYQIVREPRYSCQNEITRPPQSWCYVEEFEEKQ